MIIPSVTFVSNSTQHTLRLPTELHRRLLLGSRMVEEAHRTRWQRSELLKDAPGISVNNVVDWLTDEIIDSCLNSCVKDLEHMSDNLIDDMVLNELDYSGASSLDVCSSFAASSRIVEDWENSKKTLPAPLVIDEDAFEVPTISTCTSIEDRAAVDSSLRPVHTPMRYSAITEEVFEFSNQSTPRSVNNRQTSSNIGEELCSESNLNVRDCYPSNTESTANVSDDSHKKIHSVESKSMLPLSEKSSLQQLSEELTALTMSHSVGKMVVTQLPVEKVFDDAIKKELSKVSSDYSVDFESETVHDMEERVEKTSIASSSDTMNDVLRLSQLLSDPETSESIELTLSD